MTPSGRERAGDFLIGLGVGLILASLPFFHASRVPPESRVIQAARELGMIFPEEFPLVEEARSGPGVPGPAAPETGSDRNGPPAPPAETGEPEPQPVVVVVQPGMAAWEIGEALVRAKVVGSLQEFLAAVRRADAARRIRPGRYEIPPGEDPDRIVKRLTGGA